MGPRAESREGFSEPFASIYVRVTVLSTEVHLIFPFLLLIWCVGAEAVNIESCYYELVVVIAEGTGLSSASSYENRVSNLARWKTWTPLRTCVGLGNQENDKSFLPLRFLFIQQICNNHILSSFVL